MSIKGFAAGTMIAAGLSAGALGAAGAASASTGGAPPPPTNSVQSNPSLTSNNTQTTVNVGNPAIQINPTVQVVLFSRNVVLANSNGDVTSGSPVQSVTNTIKVKQHVHQSVSTSTPKKPKHSRGGDN